MSDPIPLLTREQRRRLLDALNNLPLFEQEQGRDLLLSDLPGTLIQSVPRSDTKIIDLEAIVRTVEAWGTLDDGTPALAILIENARFYGQGGNAGRSLEELSTELGALLQPKPLTPAAEVKESTDPVAPAQVSAAAEPPVAEAAKADAPAPTVVAPPEAAPALEPALAPALDSTPPMTIDERVTALTTARAGQQWVEVLTLARQLGRNLPLAAMGPVAEAWRRLSLTAQALQGHSKKILGLAISADSHYAVTAAADNTLILWDLPTGQAVRTFREEDRAFWAAAFTPDGQHVLSGSEGGQLTVWDLAAGTAISHIRVNMVDPIYALAVLPGGQQVVTGGMDAKLKLWDLASGQLIHEMRIGGAVFPQVTSLALLPNGTQVVSGSNRFIEMWDLAVGQQMLTFTNAVDNDFTPVAVAPDGARVLAALGDYSLTFWTLPSTTPTLHLTGHSKTVRGVAITPNGYYALSGAEDDTIRLWDLALGQQVFQFTAGVGGVTALALSPDGRTLLYAGNDPLLHVLPLPPGLFA